jgi:hypothetical protein
MRIRPDRFLEQLRFDTIRREAENEHSVGDDQLLSLLRDVRVCRIFMSCELLIAVCGCGHKTQQIKDRASISGTVTLNGNPLPAGTIGLESANGAVTTAIPIAAGGTFSSDRAPIGKNLVTVDTASIHFGNPAAYVPIPEKYINSRTSGLSVDIKPGANENVEFKLVK